MSTNFSGGSERPWVLAGVVIGLVFVAGVAAVMHEVVMLAAEWVFG